MTQTNHQRQARAAFGVSLILVTVISWAVLRDNLRTAPFHGDEASWIASSFYYTDLLLARDLTWEKWDCQSCGAWGSLNLNLGKWLIGLPLKVYSESRLNGQEFTQYYNFSKPLAVNQAEGRTPPGEIWLFGRRTSIVFGALTCAIAFVIGFLVADLLVGWIFVGLLLANHIFVASATRAMTDVHYNLFLLCFLLAATWFVARPRAARWSSIVCGLCAGLACSVKVTGLPIAGMVFLILVAYGQILRTHRIRNGLVFIALFVIAALVTIYVLNPFFWPSFSGIQGATVRGELQTIIANAGSSGLPSAGVLRSDYPQVARLARPLGFPQLIGRWNQNLASLMRISLWQTDNRVLELHQSLARFASSVPLLWLLIPIGVAYCAARVWRAFKSKRSSLLVVPGVYFLVNYLFIVVALKQNWDRFYLPTVIASTLVMAIALGAAVGQAIIWSRQALRRLASTGIAAEQRSRPAFRWIGLVRALPWVLVIALSGLNVLYMSRLGPNDDAYITYRVARNLADGLGPVFNPGELVLTVTTPGYMLLLAAASVASHDFVLLGLVLNGLALLAVGGFVIDLSSLAFSVRPDADPLGLLSALSASLAVGLTLTFPLLSAAIGMETPLFMAAILATFAAYWRALRPSSGRSSKTRWLLWTAIAAALAFLLRPDGVLVAVAIGLHWLVTRRRVAWQPLALFVALSLPWLVFAWLYYGSPIPNTLVAKATQGLGETVPRWGPGLVQTAGDWAQQFPVAAVLAVIGLVLALTRRQSGRLPMLLWAALAIVAHTLLGVRSYFWYYVPFAPVLGLLAGDAAATGTGWLAGWLGQRRLAGLATGLVAVALALAALVPAAAAAATLAEPPVPRRREQAYLGSGAILRELCSAGQDSFQVGVAEIGLIGYVSDCPIVDFAGLLQRDVAHLRIPAADKMTWTIQRYQPEFVVLSGGIGYPSVLSNAPWFRQRYEPVDQVELEGYRSVVYRRGLGPEEQRDLRNAAWWRSADASQAIEQPLYFPPGASPAITLHAFLPPESSLAVSTNGQPLVTQAGSQLAWQDLPLPSIAPIEGPVALSMAGSASDQPAAVAWIESNALPSVHYFVPLEDASIRPRPTIPLDPGASLSVQLARPSRSPVALELLYRDRPGVRLAVYVDGELRGLVGGTDGWRVDQIPLPDAPVYTIELRNQGDGLIRISYVALVRPFDAAVEK